MSSNSSSERWERDYSLVRDGLLRLKKGDNTKDIEARIKLLEQDLAKLADDGTLQQKRRKVADLVKSVVVRQAENNQQPSAMSSSSSASAAFSNQQQTTEQLLEEQNEAMRRQDLALEGISRKIGGLETVAGQIGETADLHVSLLNEMDIEADGVTAAIQRDNRRVREVAVASDTRRLHCVIMSLVATFIVMLVVKL